MKKILVATIILSLMLASLPLVAACAKQTPAPAPVPAPAPKPATTPTPAATPAPAPKAEKVVLKAVSDGLELDSMRGFKLLMEKVNELGKGNLVINYVGGPEAIPRAEQPGACKKGVVDIAVIPISTYRAEIPEGSAIEISHITWAQERQTGFLELFRQLHKERMGLFLLGGSNKGGSFIIGLNKMVSKPQDLAGLKLRTGAILIPLYKALGVSGVTTTAAEQYEAIERGVIDGWGYIAGMAIEQGLHEVTKYWIDHFLYGGGSVQIIINLDKWNKLPKEYQDIFEKVQAETEPVIETWWKTSHQKAFETFKAKGMKSIKFSDADAKWLTDLSLKVQWDEMEKTVKPDILAKLKEMLKK